MHDIRRMLQPPAWSRMTETLSGGCAQAVGDAISGILLVEVALRRRGWGLPDWAALYADLPSRQSKVRRGRPLSKCTAQS
jgi:hypothetical protein